MAGLSGSAFGIMFRKDWWSKLAVVSAIVSIGVIVPWWQTVPTGAKVGAFFDLLVLFLMLSPLKEKTVDFLG